MTQEQLRPFRFWEQICSTMNLCLAFELQGPVGEELVSKAWSLIKKEYPYFASTIVQDEHGQLLFKSPATETVNPLPHADYVYFLTECTMDKLFMQPI